MLKTSVIVPLYNQARFLEDAVASVRAGAPDEIIVVDNGSQDSPSLARTDDVTWIRLEQNQGPSAARNAGARAAQGDILIFLDGDDRLRSGCLENRVQWFAENANLGLVQGNFHVVDEFGNFLREDPPAYPTGPIDPWQAAAEQSCVTAGLAVRRSVFEQVGGFDEELWVGEDSDLLIRMLPHALGVYDPHPLAEYRMVGSSLSRRFDRFVHDYRQQMAKNRPLYASDPARYDAICRATYYRLIRDRVLTKLYREQGFFAMAREAVRLKLTGHLVRATFEKVERLVRPRSS